MARSAAAHLEEIYKACAYILTRTEHITQDDYLSDIDLRFAIERNFIIIGEAMAILRRAFPDTSAKIKDPADIVGFRNFLVHQLPRSR